jgi:hypothetical protein
MPRAPSLAQVDDTRAKSPAIHRPVSRHPNGSYLRANPTTSRGPTKRSSPVASTLKHRAKAACLEAVKTAAARNGYDLVERTFYSPLPDVEHLPAYLWPGPRPLHGVDLRVPEASKLLDEILRPYVAEFAPQRSRNPGGGFYLDNGTYESVDAETLYAIIRHFKPSRLIELGSGASSHVIADARKANDRDGRAFAHTIFDPYPFQASPLGPVDAEVHRERTEDLPLATFERLAADDVLFVDTTHTVKTGGDVSHIVLNILPSLRPGVIVHLHDIFLPYEYPREWVVERRGAYAEQYLLQAFLAFNPAYEVLFPAQAVARQAEELTRSVVQSFRPGTCPGAFWLRVI